MASLQLCGVSEKSIEVQKLICSHVVCNLKCTVSALSIIIGHLRMLTK